MKKVFVCIIIIALMVITTGSYASGKNDYKYVILDDQTIRIIQAPYTVNDTTVIPAKIDGYNVSSVYGLALQLTGSRRIVFSEGIKEFVGSPQNSSIREISIPSTMSTLFTSGEKGIHLSRCNSIEKITIKGNNPTFGVNNGCVYNKQTNELLYYPVAAKAKGLTTPKGIETISAYAFHGNRYLENINISEGVTEIGEYAFCDCEKLRSVTLPSTLFLASFNGENFKSCPQLSKVSVAKNNPSLEVVNGALIDKENQKLLFMPEKSGVNNYVVPETVKDIERFAFEDCDNLVSVYIPGTVEIIEEAAFKNCKNLRSVTIEEGVKYISRNAIMNCPRLKDQLVYPQSAEIYDEVPEQYASKTDKFSMDY